MTESRRARREEDFKATADAIATKAERVAALEEEKSKLAPDDPVARGISLEVEDIIDSMDEDSAIQRSLTVGGGGEGYSN
jgi:hypothetical protein